MDFFLCGIGYISDTFLFFRSSTQLFLCTCNSRGNHQTLYFILKADDFFHSKVASENFHSLVALDWEIVQLGDILFNHTADVLVLAFQVPCKYLRSAAFGLHKCSSLNG